MSNSRAYNFLKRGCGARTADATLVAGINDFSGAAASFEQRLHNYHDGNITLCDGLV